MIPSGPFSSIHMLIVELEDYWRNLILLNTLKSETEREYSIYCVYSVYKDWRMLDNISEVRQ